PRAPAFQIRRSRWRRLPGAASPRPARPERAERANNHEGTASDSERRRGSGGIGEAQAAKRPSIARAPGTRMLFQRVLRALTTLLGTTLIIFILVRVVPADPAVSIAGPKADPETLAAIRKDLGLDDPLPVQYGRYVGRLFHGDLGRSYMTGRRVADVIAERVPPTALLAVTSLGIGFLLGLV